MRASTTARLFAVVAGVIVLSAPVTVLAEESTTTTESVADEGAEPGGTSGSDTTSGDASTTTGSPDPVDIAPDGTPETAVASAEVGVEGAETSGSPEAAALFTTSELLTTAETPAPSAVTIKITTPLDGSTVPPDAPLEVEGTVTIGVLGTGVSIVYVVDVSGSTRGDAGDCNGDGVTDAADDLNGDGDDGEIIDCEIAGVKELEKQLAAINGSIETGLVSFASDSSLETGFGAPGRVELDDAVSDLLPGGGTDFDDALKGMNTLFGDAAAGNRKIGYFFTDGQSSVSEGAGTDLQAAIDAGIVVNTFAVGAGTDGCGPDSPLTIIANATGGQCIAVDDPADLAAVLEGLRPAGIEKVEVTVNGGPPVEASVDLLGNFKATVTGIVIGPNKIRATVTTTDQQTASDEVTVNAAAPTTAPAPAPTTTVVESAPPVVESGAPTAAAPASAPNSLPRTGNDSLLIVLIAGALMLGGAALTIGARRERHAS